MVFYLLKIRFDQSLPKSSHKFLICTNHSPNYCHTFLRVLALSCLILRNWEENIFEENMGGVMEQGEKKAQRPDKSRRENN